MKLRFKIIRIFINKCYKNTFENTAFLDQHSGKAITAAKATTHTYSKKGEREQTSNCIKLLFYLIYY